MKVLIIEPLFFELPNDFKGTLGDALFLLAKYHCEEGVKNPERMVGTVGEKADSAELWEDFRLGKRAGKLIGALGCAEWDGEKWIWLCNDKME